MTSTPLDYRPPEAPRRRRRWTWRAAGVVAALLLLSAVPTLLVRTVESRMDGVTGSMRWVTHWPLGITSGQRVDVSPLETRLRNSGIAWTPSWQILHYTERDIFGLTIGRACGRAPPIYSNHFTLGAFAAASTDAELTEFVRVMQFGTEAERQAAADAAGEKGMRAMASATGPAMPTALP